MWICERCGRVWSDISVRNSPLGKRCLCGGTLRKLGKRKGYYIRIGYLDSILNPCKPTLCRTPFHYPKVLPKHTIGR